MSGDGMQFLIQYLEGGPQRAFPPANEVRARLRSAMDSIPLTTVLLGWDLPPALTEACAEECARKAIDLYLWFPLLSGHGAFRPDPDWHVIGLADQPLAGHANALEFTFLCPNKPAALAAALDELDAALGGGRYQGVFLDRIRFPSPAGDPARDLGCFCGDCRKTARRMGLDLASIQRDLQARAGTAVGRHEITRSLVAYQATDQGEVDLPAVRDLMGLRRASIAAAVESAAGVARGRAMGLGLDCFSPTLAGMVGQDLGALDRLADWIKVMTYIRACGPASIPFELLGLVDWVVAGGEPEDRVLSALADAAGWPLPAQREAIRRGGLPSDILAIEISRGRAMGVTHLLAGIELVEVPGVAELTPAQIRADAEAVLASAPDGVVFSWDLWLMPEDRLAQAAAWYGHPPA